MQHVKICTLSIKHFSSWRPESNIRIQSHPCTNTLSCNKSGLAQVERNTVKKKKEILSSRCILGGTVELGGGRGGEKFGEQKYE